MASTGGEAGAAADLKALLPAHLELPADFRTVRIMPTGLVDVEPRARAATGVVFIRRQLREKGAREDVELRWHKRRRWLEMAAQAAVVAGEDG
jgi:hypothetical protein